MLTPRELEVVDVVGEVMQERLAEQRREYEGKLSELTAKVEALEARPDSANLVAPVNEMAHAVAAVNKRIAALPPPPDLAPLEAKVAELETRPTGEEVLKLAQAALTSTRASLLETLQISVLDLFKALPIPEKGDPGEPGKGVTIEDFRSLFEAEYAKFELQTERRIMDTIQRTLDRIPLPTNGKDGADGFGFDDFSPQFDGERTITFRFVQGERVKEFPFVLPYPLDGGVWKEGHRYVRGDGVSWGGSLWLAQRDAPGKPGPGADSGWRLAVKCGRDGKDGTPGLKGDPGAPGKNGRDLRYRMDGSAAS